MENAKKKKEGMVDFKGSEIKSKNGNQKDKRKSYMKGSKMRIQICLPSLSSITNR